MISAIVERLAARRRFGMKPGLGTISSLCAALGHPERAIGKVVHVAGTNGKGAVCAILDALLRADGSRVGRYTSPHLVRLNERFFLDGAPVADAVLEKVAGRVAPAVEALGAEVTFFEALTAVAFELYRTAAVDWSVLEAGLGGRLDATNVCAPALAVITRVGLDHCDWLGDTVEQIAAEKAGIVKPGVPVVLGANVGSVRAVVAARAREVGAPLYYAPELVDLSEVPACLSLKGSFNRENAQTALAALKVLGERRFLPSLSFSLHPSSLSSVVWPGRFQQIGNVLVDGAHNPPAAHALAAALLERQGGAAPRAEYTLVAGFCGDKDVDAVLRILQPFAVRGYAVKTANPRSLAAAETARRMNAAGIPSEPAESLAALLRGLSAGGASATPVLVCGSLFLAGEALVALDAYSEAARFDPSESLRADF